MTRSTTPPRFLQTLRQTSVLSLPTAPATLARQPVTRLFTDLAKRLDDDCRTQCGGSVGEGLDETLTVLTLHLSARPQRSLVTTNAAESLLSRTINTTRLSAWVNSSVSNQCTLEVSAALWSRAS